MAYIAQFYNLKLSPKPDKKLFLKFLHLSRSVILLTSFESLIASKLCAETEHYITSDTQLNTLDSVVNTNENLTDVKDLEVINFNLQKNIGSSSPSLPKQLNTQDKLPNEFDKSNISASIISSPVASLNSIDKTDFPYLSVAPEPFNPNFRQAPPSKPLPPPPPPVTPNSKPNNYLPPFVILRNIQIDFNDELDNFDRHNQLIQSQFLFDLESKDKLIVLTGFNRFELPKFDTVTNIPLQVGIQKKIGEYNLQIAGGIDTFNRLPVALNFKAQVDRPFFVKVNGGQVQSGLFPAFIVEQGTYKSNAQTLQNQITTWRFGPNIFWQINKNTTFFSLYRFGFFNDSNYEQQSFSRLERKIGSFYVAANLFTWRFANERQEQGGYFSPGNFIVYNGEIGWEGNIFRFLRCRANANLGEQFLEGTRSNGNSYQALCTVKLASNVETDIGYKFSNVLNRDTGGSAYNNRAITGQLRIKF